RPRRLHARSIHPVPDDGRDGWARTFRGAVHRRRGGDDPARGPPRIGGSVPHHLLALRHPDDALHAEMSRGDLGRRGRLARARQGRREHVVTPGGAPLLDVRDLSKHFYRLSALTGVSVTVKPGELLGLIGPNGSGKTTLFNCVTGVLQPSLGRVAFKGED